MKNNIKQTPLPNVSKITTKDIKKFQRDSVYQEWENQQRVSLHDRNVLFKTDSYDIDTSSTYMNYAIMKNLLDEYNDYKDKLGDLKKPTGGTLITRAKNQFETDKNKIAIINLEKNITVCDRAMNIFEKKSGISRNDADGITGFLAKMVSKLPLSTVQYEITKIKNLAQRDLLNDNVKHIHNSENKVNAFYDARFKNFHQSNAYAQQRSMNTIKAGERLKEMGIEIPFINHENIETVPFLKPVNGGLGIEKHTLNPKTLSEEANLKKPAPVFNIQNIFEQNNKHKEIKEQVPYAIDLQHKTMKPK